VSISKNRKEKRKAKHYNLLRALYLIEGGHPSWLPPNNRGNLLEMKEILDELRDGNHRLTISQDEYYGNFKPNNWATLRK
jgi:hypothetical protein